MEQFFSQMQQFMLTLQHAQQHGVARLSEAFDESARLGKASLAMWADVSRTMWRQGVEGWTPPTP